MINEIVSEKFSQFEMKSLSLPLRPVSLVFVCTHTNDEFSKNEMFDVMFHRLSKQAMHPFAQVAEPKKPN